MEKVLKDDKLYSLIEFRDKIYEDLDLSKSDDIEVAFLRGDQIHASFYSFIEILVNNDFLNELEIALCVDILKDIIIKIISKIKKECSYTWC